VARSVEVSNIMPFVLSYVVHFAFLRGLVRVLRSSSINVILRLVFESAVEVSHLVASSRVLHRSQLLELTFLLVQNPEVVEHYRSEIILFLLSSTHVNLIEYLDG